MYSKPLPAITEDNKEFWDSCKRHALALQRCHECDRFRYFVSPVCMYCGSLGFNWEPVSGRGEVYSFSVIHRPPTPEWLDMVPFVYAYALLEEGPLLPTNIVDCAVDEVAIGMALEVCYDDVTPEITIPKFRPLGKEAQGSTA